MRMSIIRSCLLLVLCLGAGMLANGQTRVINDGGGECALNGGAGGLRIHTSGNSQFQVERCSANGLNDRARQFFNSGDLPPQ